MQGRRNEREVFFDKIDKIKLYVLHVYAYGKKVYFSYITSLECLHSILISNLFQTFFFYN